MPNLPVRYSQWFKEFEDIQDAEIRIFRGATNLDITAACPIAILQGEDDRISVEVDADPEDARYFSIRQTGKTVIINQSGDSCGSNIIIDGGSISISMKNNAHIYINGVEVGRNMRNQFNAKKTPRIIITAPVNSNLEANVNGNALLVSDVIHNDAYIDLSGQTKVGLAARNISIDASGQSEVIAYIGGGDLDVDISGQCHMNIEGIFSKVDADLSGMGSIQTTGTVTGDYKAKASGMGSITHKGRIEGRIRKYSSGFADIMFYG